MSAWTRNVGPVLPSALVACSALALATGMACLPAMAAEAALTPLIHAEAEAFDIPRQPLAMALLQYANQAQVQIAMPDVPGLLDDDESVSVQGRFTPQEVLEKLLSGSRYHYEITGPRTIVIRAR